MGANILKFIISIIICQLAGFFGSLFNRSSVETWYPTIVKPSFNPPDSVFAPVWIMLFIFMGIAFFFVWKDRDRPEDKPFVIILFILHLFVNIAWSAVFFGLQSIVGGFFVIILLLAMVLLLIFYFRDFSTAAALLLVPYFLWVSFATVLNYSFMVLN